VRIARGLFGLLLLVVIARWFAGAPTRNHGDN
jgi:hypothetical protein